MATYETMYIIHPETTPEGVTAVNDKLKGVLTKNKANIINFEDWGSKKLAYRVKKQVKGFFCLINYDGPAKAINEFERAMKISEDVIKFLSVQLSKDDVERLEKKITARKNAKTEAEAAPAKEEAKEPEAKAEEAAEETVEEPAEEAASEAESTEELAEEAKETDSEEAEEEAKETDSEEAEEEAKETDSEEAEEEAKDES